MCERIRFVISLVYYHRSHRSSTVTVVNMAPPAALFFTITTGGQ